MELLIIISIAFGLGGIAFGIYRQSICIKRDQSTIKENEILQDLNKSLHDTRLNLEKENELLFNSNKKISEEYNENIVKEKNLIEEINQLIQQKQKNELEIKNQEQQKQGLEAQMGTLNRSIDELTSNQKAAVRAAFESYCDALDFEYQAKEREFNEDLANLDKLYLSRQNEFLRQVADIEQDLIRKREECERDLGLIRSELDKIKSSRAAAIEAQLREQEIKDQATFYTLQLNEADMRDVAYLRSIEFNLREARPLRMLIWSTFYRDKLNELAARVGAIGACGIYKITHIDSGISYIGQAKDIKERWVKEVKEALGIDAPATNQRCNFMREKGVDHFTFEILEKCSITELNEKEKFYIDLYQTYEFGLNGNKGIGQK